jgi:hypothetical protein
VDDQVLVQLGPLQQDQVPGGVTAEAPEAGDAEQPRREDDPHAAQVDRLGVQLERV